MRTLGEQLNDHGWQCGSVFPEELLPATVACLEHPADASPDPPTAEDWLVVVSQTCDLVADTIQQEPYVEILWCRAIERPRSQYCNLRSTRILDFRPNRTTHPALALTAHCGQDRYLVPRSILLDAKPRQDRKLSDAATRRAQAWIALRYSRPDVPPHLSSRRV
jgi:hypothetical protein